MLRQVPHKPYFIIGAGRAARHISSYFSLKNIPFQSWSRAEDRPLEESQKDIESAQAILLLISDDAVLDFIREHSWLRNLPLVHCVGSLYTPEAVGVHPLMTFSQTQLYSLDLYEKMPFVLDEGSSFQKIFPNLKNPHFYISPDQKPYYHSLCVMALNFPQILWTSVQQRAVESLGLPKNIFDASLMRCMESWMSSGGKALTGPLGRQDTETIDRNLRSLEQDEMQKLFNSFIEFYASETVKKETQREHTTQIQGF